MTLRGTKCYVCSSNKRAAHTSNSLATHKPICITYNKYSCITLVSCQMGSLAGRFQLLHCISLATRIWLLDLSKHRNCISVSNRVVLTLGAVLIAGHREKPTKRMNTVNRDNQAMQSGTSRGGQRCMSPRSNLSGRRLGAWWLSYGLWEGGACRKGGRNVWVGEDCVIEAVVLREGERKSWYGMWVSIIQNIYSRL